MDKLHLSLSEQVVHALILNFAVFATSSKIFLFLNQLMVHISTVSFGRLKRIHVLRFRRNMPARVEVMARIEKVTIKAISSVPVRIARRIAVIVKIMPEERNIMVKVRGYRKVAFTAPFSVVIFISVLSRSKSVSGT